MLVLKRKDGQWVEITHRSGDVIRIKVYEISGRFPARANLAFDDPARNFQVQRPERGLRVAQPDAPSSPPGDPNENTSASASA